MSAKITGLVFDRYPGGGGEMLLALALADHAHDDGSHVYPTVSSLALKTRQSERAVQYQLRRMQITGWLQLVSVACKGRGSAREYRISPDWLTGGLLEPVTDEAADLLKGANFAPFSASVCTLSEGGDGCKTTHKRVQPGSPSIQPQEPSISLPLPLSEGNVNSSKGSDSGKLIGIKAWLADCSARKVIPIPEGHAVFGYCATVGISREILAVHWREFKARRSESSKRQRDWPQTFLNSVRDNWFRLWYLRPGMPAEWTTQGLQAQLVQRAAAEGDEAQGDAQGRAV